MIIVGTLALALVGTITVICHMNGTNIYACGAAIARWCAKRRVKLSTESEAQLGAVIDARRARPSEQ
jgi:hypothetical protein